MKEHVGMESQKSNMVWVRGYRTPWYTPVVIHKAYKYTDHAQMVNFISLCIFIHELFFQAHKLFFKMPGCARASDWYYYCKL
jgi:hypothetical protein